MLQNFNEIVRRNVTRAYLSSYDQASLSRNIVVLAEHPDVSMTPMPKAESFVQLELVHRGNTERLKVIVLNITPSAVRLLEQLDDGIEFDCQFNGVTTSVYVPYEAMYSITSAQGSLPLLPDLDYILQARIDNKVRKIVKPQTYVEARPALIRVK